MIEDHLRECLTFDDVLLVPAYSEVLPRDVDVRTRLCRGVELNVPLVTVTPGVSADEAKQLLHQHRIEKLLVVESGKLVGLITIKDILQADRNPSAVKDGKGRLRVGAAIGPGPDREERADALVAAGVDVLVIDTAHGHSKGVIDAVRATKKKHPNVPVIAGN